MCGSGDRPPLSQTARSCHRSTCGRHSCADSVSTASRARTSSPRLVSWVDSVVMVAGQRRARWPAKAWNSPGVTPKRSGSPPTSFSAISRVQR